MKILVYLCTDIKLFSKTKIAMMKKIAIPTRNNMVDDQFGHCDHYSVFTIDDNRHIVSSECMVSPKGCGCKTDIISEMQKNGISILLAGNMGVSVFEKLAKNGISVIRGCYGCILDVLYAYMNGKLVDSAESCKHHDCKKHTDAPVLLIPFV